MELFDAHMHTCHAPDFSPVEGNIYLSCAGGPEDWHPLLRETRKGIHIFLGIHPLSLSEDPQRDISLLEELTGLIGVSPQAGVGECGLDRRGYKQTSRTRQEETLRHQIHLAVRFGRPLSLHQVNASGALAEVLEKEKPTVPFLVHGFREKEETAKRYLKLGAYLSLGPGKHWVDPGFRDLLRRLPRNRILLESDWPYSPPPYGETMNNLYETAAEVLRIDRKELLNIVKTNGKVFTN